jgi:carbonic anhydrase
VNIKRINDGEWRKISDHSRNTALLGNRPRLSVQSLSDYYLPNLHTHVRNNDTMSPPNLQQLLERNRAYAPTHTPSPTVAEMAVSAPPGTRVLVVTCADPRCEPYQFLNIARWEAIAIRSVGGRIEPLIPGILALDTLFNFEELAIIHHTDCGGTIFTKDSVSSVLKERVPDSSDAIDELKFGDFTDIAGSVKEDLGIWRKNPFASKQLRDNSYGFVFDIKTGELIKVDA